MSITEKDWRTFPRAEVVSAWDKAHTAAGDTGADAGSPVWMEAYSDAFTTALGITVAPDKPEPGTWHVGTGAGWGGCPAFVQEDGSLIAFASDGTHAVYEADHPSWPALTPARVVSEADVRTSSDDSKIQAWDRISEHPAFRDCLNGEGSLLDRMLATLDRLVATPAEPPVLTEEEVGELWDRVAPMNVPWQALNQDERQTFDWGIQSALAKHCGTRELPTRDQVKEAICLAYFNPGAKTDRETLNHITDTVVALLEGGNRGE